MRFVSCLATDSVLNCGLTIWPAVAVRWAPQAQSVKILVLGRGRSSGGGLAGHHLVQPQGTITTHSNASPEIREGASPYQSGDPSDGFFQAFPKGRRF